MIIDYDVRAVAGQTLGNCLPDSLATAGNNRDFSCEIHLSLKSRAGMSLRLIAFKAHPRCSTPAFSLQTHDNDVDLLCRRSAPAHPYPRGNCIGGSNCHVRARTDRKSTRLNSSD